jgi:K+-transporting ATPase ATPase C chain
MTKQLRSVVAIFLLLSVASGVVYPLVVTGVAQLVFQPRANGSLITHEERAIGSALIGQNFDTPGYFWGRPSATGGNAYNALASGGSNQGPTNPALIDAAKQRIAALRAADPSNTRLIPVDLVTASASGLDPHISRAAAEYQAARVAQARSANETQVRALIERHASPRWLGVFGEATVNVLELNMALDATLDSRPAMRGS